MPDQSGPDQSSFSFSLRSGLMTSGCVVRFGRGLGRLFLRPAHDHVSQEQVGIGIHRHVRRQGQVADVNTLVDLKVTDVGLDRARGSRRPCT